MRNSFVHDFFSNFQDLILPFQRIFLQPQHVKLYGWKKILFYFPLSVLYNIKTCAPDFRNPYISVLIMTRVYRDIPLLTIGPDSARKESYRVVAEERLRIFLNRRPLVEMQYLPGREKELGVGFLRSAGLISHKDQIVSIDWNLQNSNLQIEAKVDEERSEDFLKHLTLGSGCGLSLADTDTSAEEAIQTGIQFNRESVRKNLIDFLEKSRTGRKTRGVHSAAVYLGEKSLCQADDIGRHNAVDKVLGECFLKEISLTEAMLLTTGRLTFEMVVKALRHEVPLTATRSVASTMAVDLAEKFHICLAGGLRREKFTIYSASYRISI
jgi:FdhD protein